MTYSIPTIHQMKILTSKKKTNNKFLILLLFFIHSAVTSQEVIETENREPENIVLHLNEMGNIISYKKSIELMQTGEYISIPKVNTKLETEYLIKKKGINNLEEHQYKTFTDGKTVLSKKNPFKYNTEVS